MIITIYILVYIVVGMVSATICILMDGEPGSEGPWIIIAAVLFWPVFMPILLPVYVARWIKWCWSKTYWAKSYEKPHAYLEEFEP